MASPEPRWALLLPGLTASPGTGGGARAIRGHCPGLQWPSCAQGCARSCGTLRGDPDTARAAAAPREPTEEQQERDQPWQPRGFSCCLSWALDASTAPAPPSLGLLPHQHGARWHSSVPAVSWPCLCPLRGLAQTGVTRSCWSL